MYDDQWLTYLQTLYIADGENIDVKLEAIVSVHEARAAASQP